MEEEKERIRCISCGKVLFEAKKAKELSIVCPICKKKYLISIESKKVDLKQEINI